MDDPEPGRDLGPMVEVQGSAVNMQH